MSTRKIAPEYMKLSERFRSSPLFKGLKLDQDGRMRDHTRGSVSLKELKMVLLSKDMALYESYRKRYLDDKVLRFLDGEPVEGDKVCY